MVGLKLKNKEKGMKTHQFLMAILLGLAIGVAGFGRLQAGVGHEGCGDVAAMKEVKRDNGKSPKGSVWVCPMKCYEGDKKGKCPKCGMKLKKETRETVKAGEAVKRNVCPVAGEPIPEGGGYVHTLKNGKKVKLCCAGCASAVNKDPEKCKAYWY